MNNLNSVLIEGKIDEVYDKYKSDVECKISISSIRFIKKGSGIEKQGIFIDVVLPISYKTLCKTNCDVRVVGRLGQDKKMRHYIEAEHIEFIPEFKKEKKQ